MESGNRVVGGIVVSVSAQFTKVKTERYFICF